MLVRLEKNALILAAHPEIVEKIMAFDRPIQADLADDSGEGLLSSILRATVWLLGGDQSQKDQENDSLRKVALTSADDDEDKNEGNDDDDDDCDNENESVRDGSENIDPSENRVQNYDSGQFSYSDQTSDELSRSFQGKESKAPQVQESSTSNKENDSSFEPWPQVGVMDSDDDYDEVGTNQRLPTEARSSSSRGCASSREPTMKSDSPGLRRGSYDESARSSGGMDGPATKLVDELVAVMESSSLSCPSNSNMNERHRSSSALPESTKLMGSYSDSSFSSHEKPLKLTRHRSLNNVSCSKSKKTSWSDECGHRSLVEYFDESKTQPRNRGHWSNAKRNSYKLHRKSSFDGTVVNSTNEKGEVKVIKSALRRSGSYSPPMQNFANSIHSTHSSSATSSSGSSSSASSTQRFKSFRSLSAIGSSCSLNSIHSSDSPSQCSDSFKTDGTLDVQCVPSTLQSGSGQANGGLIIPRGGPGMVGLAGYQLILGTGVSQMGAQQRGAPVEKERQGEGNVSPINEGNPGIMSKPKMKGSPHHHHQFLPHSNGYISPQYGFYVNITPPTPEMYFSRPHPGKDETSQSAIHQHYQQFQFQKQYHHPSPIPEGRASNMNPQQHPSPTVNKDNIKQCGGTLVSDPKAAAMQRSLKPTFKNNKKGMGMVLAGNTHHVWPTVPFG